MRVPSKQIAAVLLAWPLYWLSGTSVAQSEYTETATGSTRAKISDFLQYFIDADKTAAEQAALFTEDAEYYDHGQVSKREIARDVERYSRRWPYREYRLAKIHYITPDPDSDRAFVSYEIDYKVGNATKSAAGKAYYGAVIANLDTMPQIEWIKERVGR